MLLCVCVQAEDGIRDSSVTGVQTCALPIWRGEERRGEERRGEAPNFRQGVCAAVPVLSASPVQAVCICVCLCVGFCGWLGGVLLCVCVVRCVCCGCVVLCGCVCGCVCVCVLVCE